MGIKIREKEDVTVAERVSLAQAAGGFSMTAVEQFQMADRWFCKVTILCGTDGSQQYIGTAEIKINAAKDTPDGSTPIECAETSALGRALGFAGFGSFESIATADEIVRSQPNQAQYEQRVIMAQPSPIRAQTHLSETVAAQAPVEGLAMPAPTITSAPVEVREAPVSQAQLQVIERTCKKNHLPMPTGLTQFSNEQAKQWISENPFSKPEPYGFHQRESTRLNPKTSMKDLISGRA